MAVVVVSNVRLYEGLSTDAKPTGPLPQGSMFTETDTGIVSLWNGTTWRQQPGSAATIDTEAGIATILLACLNELGKIRRMTAIANEIDDEELEPDSPMVS